MSGGSESTEDVLTVSGAVRQFQTPEGTWLRALDGIDLAIRNNEFLTLLGPSGCGKTTLLRVIAGLDDLDSGTLTLEGRPLDDVPAHRRPFNTVFQSYALFPHLSVEDNVGYGLDVAGIRPSERRRRVADGLSMVGLGDLGRRMPQQLSGGQQQRVALVRALVNNPKLLLLDEPLSALDRKLRGQMQIELKALQHKVGITFIFVTHDQEEALTMSDRIAVMNKGRIQQLATPFETYHHPANRFVAGFVGNSNLLGGRVVAADRGDLKIETEGGLTLIAGGAGFAVGDAVDVLLRPEFLSLAPVVVGDVAPTLEAQVEQAVFVGSEIHIHARTDRGLALMVLDRTAAGRGDGTADVGRVVRFHYDPSHVHVMRTGGTP